VSTGSKQPILHDRVEELFVTHAGPRLASE